MLQGVQQRLQQHHQHRLDAAFMVAHTQKQQKAGAVAVDVAITGAVTAAGSTAATYAAEQHAS